MAVSLYLRFAFVLSLLFAITVDGHGVPVVPRFRGTECGASLSVPNLNIADVTCDYCPHCLNAGGVGNVARYANGTWKPYDPIRGSFRNDHGLCGDPYQGPLDHMKSGKFGPTAARPYAKVYKQGQIVEFTVELTTNHDGFYEFFICNVGKCGGDISEECFKKNKCKRLIRAETPECESWSSKECGAIDRNYPGRWYNPCRGSGIGLFGGKYMRYQLPKNFKCKNCVIQWYWSAANSCHPPGFHDYFTKNSQGVKNICGSDLGGRQNLRECGGSTFPEEYWACADVKVEKAKKF